MNEGVIALGSNIDPESNFDQALTLLARKTPILKRSQWVRTAPIGITEQADFLNGVVLVRTDESLEAFDADLKKIEDLMERDRTQPKFGPRIIDLDIVVWNGEIVDEDYHQREFLRQSVREVLPDFIPEGHGEVYYPRVPFQSVC